MAEIRDHLARGQSYSEEDPVRGRVYGVRGDLCDLRDAVERIIWHYRPEPVPTGESDAIDAARWRFLREYLDTEGDTEGDDGMAASYTWVRADEDLLQRDTVVKGRFRSIEELVDEAIRRCSGPAEPTPEEAR
jgi:hypothetical protein